MKKLLKRLNLQQGTASANTLSDPNIAPLLNPGEGVVKFVLNRKGVAPGVFYKRFTTVLKPGSLTATGGILLKAGILNNTFHLGILPSYHEGERGYHYDIHLSVENEFTLIGGITAQRELTILFKGTDVTDEKRVEYRRAYRALARVIDQCSGDDTVTLDWITGKLIEEQQVFSHSVKYLADIIH